MDQTVSTSFTLKLPDFIHFSSNNYQLSTSLDCKSFIECKGQKFSLEIEFERKPFSSNDHCEISLTRAFNGVNDPDLTILWRISLIDQNGDECLSRDIETGFSSKSQCYAIFGGLYKIDQNFIRNPTNRLLTDGALIIKTQITVLGKSLQIDLQKPNVIAKKALQNYESLLASSKHSDVVFVVGTDKKQFKLHTQILSAQSVVFSRMFDNSDSIENNKQNRVELTDIEVEAFELFLDFIYGGKISSLDKYAADLLVLSNKYQLELLKQLCVQTLCTTKSSLTVDNVATVLTLADISNAAELKSKCIEFITANASKVIDTDGLKQMALNNVKLMMELYRDMAVRPNKKQRKM